MMKDKTAEMTESFPLLALLTMSGGLMDAYSYLGRGHVFANAQTGNLLLLGVNLANGSFAQALTYLCPVLAFALGVFLAELTRRHLKCGAMLWQQMNVLFVALTLALVSFLPQSANLLANSLTSMACGTQLQSFRKVYGHGVATTMCIGNLRTATESLCTYFHEKNPAALRKSLLFFGIILTFIAGAVIGDLALVYLKEKAILVSSAFLLVAFTLMFIKRKYKEK